MLYLKVANKILNAHNKALQLIEVAEMSVFCSAHHSLNKGTEMSHKYVLLLCVNYK